LEAKLQIMVVFNVHSTAGYMTVKQEHA
jgi:hypothetical protein